MLPRFYKSRDDKVTVVLTTEKTDAIVTVFDKQIGGQFSIQGRELYKDDRFVFRDTTEKEMMEWLRQVGFKIAEN
jgi:hypothetical protein